MKNNHKFSHNAILNTWEAVITTPFSLKLLAKTLLGASLWYASKNSPFLRQKLCRLAMKTLVVCKEGCVYFPEGNTINLTHIHLDYQSYQQHWRGWKFYEPLTFLLIKELITQKDSFFTIGANNGYEALYASAFAPHLSIVAFEPNPLMAAIIRSNIEANQISNIVCEELAVSDKTGNSTFFLPSSNLSGSLEEEFNEEIKDVLHVKTVSLDNYTQEHNTPGKLLIKAIIEGHESKLILGATDLIANNKPDMILSVAREYDPNALSFLKTNGYKFYHITKKGFIKKDTLTPNNAMIGNTLFLDYFITCMDDKEVQQLKATVTKKIKTINFSFTSHNRPGWKPE